MNQGRVPDLGLSSEEVSFLLDHFLRLYALHTSPVFAEALVLWNDAAKGDELHDVDETIENDVSHEATSKWLGLESLSGVVFTVNLTQ